VRIERTLKRLAVRGPSAWPVLSVYVNTRPIGPQMTTYRPFLKKRMTEELKALPQRSAEHAGLSHDFERIQHYLDYELRGSTQAVGLFASHPDGDFFEAIQVTEEWPNQLVTVGHLPTLYPLVRMADRYCRAAVLVADTHTARLFVIALGAVEVRRELSNPTLHKPHAAGELDQSNVQRHVENAWAQHARQAAQALEDLARDKSASHLLVGGDVIVPEILRHLSKAASDLLLGRHAWDIRIPEATLVAEVSRLVEEHEAGVRRKRAGAVLVKVESGGRTVAGVDATVAALREGKVNQLVLGDGFPDVAPAWACRICPGFGPGPKPSACSFCGRNEVENVELREELACRAVAQGSRVHFVEAQAMPEFDAQGSVGALLRYR
jgi:hypothetical protein